MPRPKTPPLPPWPDPARCRCGQLIYRTPRLDLNAAPDAVGRYGPDGNPLTVDRILRERAIGRPPHDCPGPLVTQGELF